MYKCIYMYIYIYVNIYIYVYVYVYICLCVYTYICIYMLTPSKIILLWSMYDFTRAISDFELTSGYQVDFPAM